MFSTKSYTKLWDNFFFCVTHFENRKLMKRPLWAKKFYFLLVFIKNGQIHVNLRVFLSQKSVKKKFQPFRKNHKYSSKKTFCKASNKSKNRNNFSNKGLIDLILFLKCSALKFDLSIEKKFFHICLRVLKIFFLYKTF